MRPETQKVLDDLRAQGVDVSSIENQIRANPLTDRVVDNIIGGGILRQKDYQRYMNDLQVKERQIESSARELATLHDTRNFVGAELPQKVLDRIKFLEDQLIATGEFDENSVRNVSINEKTALQQITQGNGNNGNRNVNQNQNQNQHQNQNRNNNNNDDYRRQLTPEGLDTSNFVDLPTHQASMANLAYGAIATNLEINAAIDEVKALGIPVDRKSIRQFQENLKTGLDKGRSLDDVVEETFKVSEVRETKAKEDRQKEIDAVIAKTKAETLKELGVPTQNRFRQGSHVIFDRNRKSPQNINVAEGNNNSGEGIDNNNNNKVAGEIPKNQFGDVEVFRTRGTRQDRLSRALEVSDEVHEFYANDPTYVP